MQSEVLNVINDLKLDMTASPVDDVTIITRAQLKAIEAALSAAEPVAWQPLYKKEVINHMRTVSNNVWEYAMTVYPTKEQAEEYGHGGHEVRALYDRPQQPAPSVAVKALGWRQFTGRENDIEAITPCGRYAIRPLITANRFRLYVPDEKEVGLYETLQEAKAAAQSYYETRIRSALSAQVQEVAGDEEWQIVPKHPTGSMIEAVVSMVDDDAPHLFLLNLYRAMLAAAPAKQEGGE